MGLEILDDNSFNKVPLNFRRLVSHITTFKLIFYVILVSLISISFIFGSLLIPLYIFPTLYIEFSWSIFLILFPSILFFILSQSRFEKFIKGHFKYLGFVNFQKEEMLIFDENEVCLKTIAYTDILKLEYATIGMKGLGSHSYSDNIIRIIKIYEENKITFLKLENNLDQSELRKIKNYRFPTLEFILKRIMPKGTLTLNKKIKKEYELLKNNDSISLN